MEFFQGATNCRRTICHVDMILSFKLQASGCDSLHVELKINYANIVLCYLFCLGEINN